MAERIFLGSETRQPAPDDALFHVIPVPYEKTVSYGGGTAEGPAAIIEASNQLETYDQLHGEPCRLGIYTQEAVDCRGEAGDILQRIRERTRATAESLRDEAFGG